MKTIIACVAIIAVAIAIGFMPSADDAPIYTEVQAKRVEQDLRHTGSAIIKTRHPDGQVLLYVQNELDGTRSVSLSVTDWTGGPTVSLLRNVVAELFPNWDIVKAEKLTHGVMARLASRAGQAVPQTGPAPEWARARAERSSGSGPRDDAALGEVESATSQ